MLEWQRIICKQKGGDWKKGNITDHSQTKKKVVACSTICIYYFLRNMRSNLAICNKALKNVETPWTINCTCSVSDMWKGFTYIHV